MVGSGSGRVLNPPCRDMARLSETIPNPGLRSRTPTDALLGTHFRGRARIGENPRIANREWREFVGAQRRCTLTVASHSSLLFPRFSFHTRVALTPALVCSHRSPRGRGRPEEAFVDTHVSRSCVRGHPRFAMEQGAGRVAVRTRCVPFAPRSVRSSIVIGAIGRSGGKLE
jgi:hypothetical protein